MKISVIGTGYVGLVSGTCFAEVGNDVVCLDYDKEKINRLTKGDMPIYEEGLEELVLKNIANKRLTFTTSYKKAVQHADVILIAVGTPPNEDGATNLEFVESAAKNIANHLDDTYKIIVNKSTVPVGTAEFVASVIKEKTPNASYDVCSVPEFLREGNAVADTFNPDRVIIGTESEKAKKTLTELHIPYTNNIMVTNIRSAELIKYGSNAFLATKISFINEIANICDQYGADIHEVAKGIGLDDRIGPKFLNAGIGYGGSCFPKDVKSLIHMAKEKNYTPEILESVEKVNQKQRYRVIDHLNMVFNHDVKNKKVAIWGLSFKPNTDDMREAPSIDVSNHLIELGAKVSAYDPISNEKAKEWISDQVEIKNSALDALGGADALILLTEWDEFKSIKIEDITERLNHKIIIDGRNIFDKDEVIKNGYIYHGIGR